MSGNAYILAHSLGYQCKPKHPIQPTSKFHFLLLILLANDVQTNPGPTPRYSVYNITDTKIILSRRRNVNAIERDQKRRLFNELTEIQPNDYAAIDRCRGCSTRVKESQRAISCDRCPYWTHLSCSDMTNEFYNANIATNFDWICNFCRDDDTLPEHQCYTPMDNSNFAKLPPKPLSDLESVEGHKILHFNCRSVKNKIDEIAYILQTTKPSILILTETWLDQSCPPGFLNFPGYHHFRKD